MLSNICSVPKAELIAFCWKASGGWSYSLSEKQAVEYGRTTAILMRTHSMVAKEIAVALGVTWKLMFELALL